MKICTSCGNKQEQGNFCGVCGSGLTEMQQSAQPTTPIPEQPVQHQNPQGQFEQQQQQQQQYTQQPVMGQQSSNPQMDQIKKISSNYFGSFVTLLKQPSRSLSEQQSFSNALISFVLFSFVIAFSIYSMINGAMEKVSDYSFGMVDTSLPVGVLIALMIIMMIGTILPTVLIFVLEKIFVQQSNFKKVFILVSNFYPLFIAVVAVAIVLSLIGTVKFSILLIVLSFLFVILLLPLYVMTHVLKGTQPAIDPFFIYLILAIAILLVIYFIGDSVVSALLDEMMGDMFDLFSGDFF